MRFLALVQIDPKNGVPSLQQIEVSDNEKVFKVGDWSIEAELNTEKAAVLKVVKSDGSVAFCSNGVLDLNGKEYGTISGSSKLFEMIEGKPVFQEVVDELPESIADVLAINKK
jgi:predicted phage-related endonuclease